MRVELGDGQWVEIREDVERIPNGDRKRIMRRFVTSDDQFDRIAEFGESLAGLLITAWSFPLPLPSEKPEVLDEIPAYDYDRISHAITGLGKGLFLSFEPTPDPSSPTPPSGG
jgi:hypothetical protein